MSPGPRLRAPRAHRRAAATQSQTRRPAPSAEAICERYTEPSSESMRSAALVPRAAPRRGEKDMLLHVDDGGVGGVGILRLSASALSGGDLSLGGEGGDDPAGVSRPVYWRSPDVATVAAGEDRDRVAIVVFGRKEPYSAAVALSDRSNRWVQRSSSHIERLEKEWLCNVLCSLCDNEIWQHSMYSLKSLSCSCLLDSVWHPRLQPIPGVISSSPCFLDWAVRPPRLQSIPGVISSRPAEFS